MYYASVDCLYEEDIMRSYTTLPTEDGQQLWLVHLTSSYYDNDPRGGGTVPVSARIFVIARTRVEALSKAQPKIDQVKLNRNLTSKVEITARPFPLEELVACRSTSQDSGPGYPTQRVVEVELTLPEDQQHFRLAVCLVDEREE